MLGFTRPYLALASVAALARLVFLTLTYFIPTPPSVKVRSMI